MPRHNRPTLGPRRHYRFPWRSGNQIELLVDGNRYFPAMLAAIDTARRYVLLEIYLCDAGRIATLFVEAFLRAAGRGVAVHLLLDDYGSSALLRQYRSRLEQAGVEVIAYNPMRWFHLRHNLLRDHRKLLLVDGQVAFIGGTGITDAFDPQTTPHHFWRENMARIEGPCVADWQTGFTSVWNAWSPAPLPIATPPPKGFSGGSHGRVVLGDRSHRADLKRSILSHVRRARRRVWIATAYFIPSWKLRRALRRAAGQGIDVRLLVPGREVDVPGVRHASRRYYGKLLRQGVRIFEYQPRFLHEKLVVCDGWVSLGSSNLDRWNLTWNLDANQEVDDPRFLAKVEATFLADLAEAREYTYAEWQIRPLGRRLAEWFWGGIDLALARLGQVPQEGEGQEPR